MLHSINPATGAITETFQPHGADIIENALADAVTAQKAWRQTSIGARCALLSNIAKVMRANKEKYARLITEEMGKPITESLGEIEKCAVTCDYYAEYAPNFLADEVIESNATESRVVFDPLGVVLAVMPWNFPFWQYFRFATSALVAGNGTLLKHASNVPRCALAIEEIITQAGAPHGLMQTLLIGSDKVAAIINDDRIAAVTLTGSTQAGKMIATQAAQGLKKAVLELGGSDPFIVLADADVALAAKMAVKARFLNNGQTCISAKRFIVEDSIADEFTSIFTEAMQKLKIGDPMDSTTEIGPMARADLRDELHEQLLRSVKDGATLVTGGEAMEGKGCYYQPTLLSDVKQGQTAFCEELFGPVASIIRCADADEAITLANDTEFGLGAALWSQNIERANRLARQIDAGSVFINGNVASDARLPFGGIKKSGYGRELGIYGIKEFTNIKTIWVGPAK
ncbi:MAG: NAD-dependent succinate-semialdehyde dehydrogenase [Alphaproteobacteria bacterium]|nr:NAD-dependent succinate-semialdehyde dehydrogenase [Alphaproteobacteria bacterium]